MIDSPIARQTTQTLRYGKAIQGLIASRLCPVRDPGISRVARQPLILRRNLDVAARGE